MIFRRGPKGALGLLRLADRAFWRPLAQVAACVGCCGPDHYRVLAAATRGQDGDDVRQRGGKLQPHASAPLERRPNRGLARWERSSFSFSLFARLAFHQTV